MDKSFQNGVEGGINVGNILDYLRWRSDLTLEQYPLCEVDNLILSQLAYLNWDIGLTATEQPTLRQIWPFMENKPFTQGMSAADDQQLLRLTACSNRFGNTKICNFTQEFSEDEDKQFAAITFLLPNDRLFVSFRGTDSTLVGWKEDFNLCLPTPIPSQLRAQAYLTKMLMEFPECPVYVGGHSKGGNLAMYACATLQENLQRRLKGVYSNDGPGLNDAAFLSDGYKRLEPILEAYVPQSSIIGMLLMHPKTYTVIRSNSVSIFQHNPYTWQVEQGRFVAENELKVSSVYTEKLLKTWLSEVDDEHRRRFVDTLFGILESTEAKSFGKELWLGVLRNPKALVDAVQGVDADTRQKLIDTLKALGNAATQSIKPNPENKSTEDEENGR